MNPLVPIESSRADAMLGVDENGTLSPPGRREIYTPPPQKEDTDVARTTPELNDSITAVYEPPSLQAPSAVRTSSKGRHEKSPPSSRESLAGWLRQGMVDHQLGLSMNLILLIGFSWLLFPTLRGRMAAFYSLAYPIGQGQFGQGPRDLQLVGALVVIFTGVRAFALDYILMPLASLLGVRRRKPKVRFAEQSFLLLYYCIYWTWGLQIFMKATPSALAEPTLTLENLLISLWTGYPLLRLDASMKLYYLSQLAFWVQQILVIHIEEKRKDHYQMLTHHVVTIALLSTSYGYRQCRVGNAVLICMDIVDLIFPLAKILRYLGLQAACDAAFALFVVTWLAARHAAYLTICWSIYAHVNEDAMSYGVYSLRQPTGTGRASGMRLSADGGREIFSNVFQPFLDPTAETVSFNARIRWTFLGLLLGLQCITLMWFVMICRVVARVLRGEGADDSRSDDEEDVETGPQPTQLTSSSAAAKNKPFIEVEATADQLSFGQGKRTGGEQVSKRRSKGFSSGLNLGDRKEILNRIGCLSEEQLAREREKRESSSSGR